MCFVLAKYNEMAVGMPKFIIVMLSDPNELKKKTEEENNRNFCRLHGS